MLGPSARPKVMYLKDVLFALFKKELRKIEKVCKYIFERFSCIKFMFSKKATKIDEIFNVELTLCSKCHTVGKTVTKKKFWSLDFTRFYCPSEFSGL